MTLVERVARELCRWECGNKGKKLLNEFFKDDEAEYLSEARRIVKMCQEDSVITRFRKLKSGKLVLKEGKA